MSLINLPNFANQHNECQGGVQIEFLLLISCNK